MIRELDFDVIVLGAGGTGCTAAIAAAREGASVALLSKESIAIGNTRISGGEIASSGVSEGDSPEILAEDMIKGGEYLNDCDLVGIVAKKASKAIQFLEGIGVFFRRDDMGRLSSKAANRLGGHRFHRSFVSPAAGMSFGQSLRNAVANTESISVFEDTLVVSLFKEEDEVRGALALDLQRSDYLVLKAGATILATGGCGWMYYPQTTNNRSATGDGYALAFEAGAQLVDMEMVQFFPFAMNHPACLAGSILDEPILAGPNGRLINGLGEVVADHDINRMTRAQVTALMAKEISAGRATPWGGLRLDLQENREIPEMIDYKKTNDERKMFEKVRRGYGEAAFEWREPWDVSPSAHYMMGGVKIDRHGASSLNQLYAAGEVAGGMMGANRLGATSLADIFVMGMEAGTSAAHVSKGSKSGKTRRSLREPLRSETIANVDRLFGRKGARRPIQMMRELQRLMRENVGIVRDERRLSHALSEIDRLEQEMEEEMAVSAIRRYNTELLDAIELKKMLSCSRMIATCARMRKESRGAHLRLDYPDKDDRNWLKNITLWKDGSGMKTQLNDVKRRKTQAANS